MYEKYKLETFKAFKYSLGMNSIDGNLDNKVHVYITSKNFKDKFYKHNATYRIKGRTNTRMKDISAISGIGNSDIVDTHIRLNNYDVFSQDINMETSNEMTYQELMNVPCSSYIFTENYQKCLVTEDLDWSVTALEDPSTNSYFRNEYNFATEYSGDEYIEYGVNRDNLIDNSTCVTMGNLIVSKEKENADCMKNGANGLLVTYEDIKAGITGEKEIPIAWCSFPSTYYSSNNYLNVEWRYDGLIKVD